MATSRGQEDYDMGDETTEETNTTTEGDENASSAAASEPAAEPKPAEPKPAQAATEPPATEPPKTPEPPSVDEMLGDPRIQAEIKKQAKLAAKTAREEEAQQAEEKARREKLEETERLKLEKEDAEKAMAAAEARAVEAERVRDLNEVLLTKDVRLQDKGALDFVRHQAFAKVKADEDLPMATAVAQVLEDHPYLIRGEEGGSGASASATEDASAASTAPKTPPKRPSTAADGKKTQTPATPAPGKGVDVMKMTRAEYEEYKRAQHQIH